MEKILVQDKETLIKMREYLESTGNFFSWDTETDGLKGDLAGFSICPANKPKKGYYVSVGHKTLFDTNVPKEVLIEVMKDFFESPDNFFIGHNISYDLITFMRYLGIKVCRGNVEDTMILAYLVDENLPKGLKQRSEYEGVTEEVISLSSLSESKNPAIVPAEAVLDYAIQDVILPPKLYKKFWKKLEEQHRRHYIEVEKPFIDLLSKMTAKGIKLDKRQIKDIEKDCEINLKKLKAQIYKIAGESFDISSAQQLSHILYTKLKLPAQKFTPKGAPSTDKVALDLLSKKVKHPIIEPLLEFSRYSILKNNFTKKLINACDENSRVHASFNRTGTVTGRLSSSDPNLQQIPRLEVYRKAFIPTTGKAFLIADYGQLELRVLAHFSQDPVMCEAIRAGRDLHDATTCQIHGFDPNTLEERKLDPEFAKMFKKLRGLSKAVNFGIVYGMGERPDMGIDSVFINKWRTAHIGAYDYIERHRKFLRKYGYTETLAGRYRRVPDALEKNRNVPFALKAKAERAGFSAHIQGSASDIVQKALVDLDIYLDQFSDADILLQVHDEVVLEALPESCLIIKPEMQRIMENPYKLNVPLEATPEMGYSWADKK